jgi:hypothetical protein
VIQPFGMGAGGDFGHNTAKIGVQRRLAFHLRAQHLAPPVGMAADHGSGRVIAAAFDAQKG